ncbi:MAG: hypothetical protein ACLR6O_04810 [Eubacterium sp.]
MHTQIIDMIACSIAYAVINSDDKIYTVCGNLSMALLLSPYLGFLLGA